MGELARGLTWEVKVASGLDVDIRRVNLKSSFLEAAVRISIKMEKEFFEAVL